MATVLAFASFDRSLRVALAPRGLLTRRRASRARGPSAPSAERAMDPCFRSLALPVGARAPLRRDPDRSGGLFRSVRSEEPAHPGRRRSASGLGTWRMRTRSASPHHTAQCCHCGCRSPGRRLGDAGRAGQLDHGVTASLRRERCGPAVTRPCGAPCGASDAAVTRRWEACNPVVKDQHPGSASTSRAQSRPSPGGCRDSRRFTRFDPRCERHSVVLFRRGVRPTSLWHSWFLRDGRLCSDSRHEGPTPLFRPAA